MSPEEERRHWIEALHAQNLWQQKLFKIILDLGKSTDREALLTAFRVALNVEPVAVDDCILFDRVALKFDENGQIQDLYVRAEGSTAPAEVVIQSSPGDQE